MAVLCAHDTTDPRYINERAFVESITASETRKKMEIRFVDVRYIYQHSVTTFAAIHRGANGARPYPIVITTMIALRHHEMKVTQNNNDVNE